MKPFDFVTDASFSKKDLMTGTEDDKQAEKDYNPWLTNKAFSYHADSVLHANEMNRLAVLDNKLQYQYFLNTLRRRKRFAKWSKAVDEPDVDVIMNRYDVNRHVARSYIKLLTADQLLLIKQQEGDGVKDHGSTKPSRKPR